MGSERRILSVKLPLEEFDALTERYREWLLVEREPISRHEYVKRLLRQTLTS
jgi:hypothetical protein